MWEPLEIGDYVVATKECLKVIKENHWTTVFPMDPHSEEIFAFFSGPLQIKGFKGTDIEFEYPESISIVVARKTYLPRTSVRRCDPPGRTDVAVPEGLCSCKSRICLHKE